MSNTSPKYEKLVNNIDEAEKKVEDSSIVDITPYLLPINEIVKMMLSQENPALDKDEVDLMVDGFGAGSEPEKEVRNIAKEADIPSQKSEMDNIISDSISEQNVYPIPEDSETYEKAKDLLSTIKQAIGDFFRKVKELAIQLVSTAVKIGSSIPGIIITVAAPPWNVAAAITSVMSIIIMLNELKSKYFDVIQVSKIFKKMNLVSKGTALDIISGIINAFFGILRNVIEPIVLLVSNFINKIIELIRKLTSKDEEEKRALKVIKKLRKLKYLPSFTRGFNAANYPDGNDPEDDDEAEDLDEIENILRDWEIVNRGTRTRPWKAVVRRREPEEGKSINDLIGELDKLKSINSDFSKSVGIDIDASKKGGDSSRTSEGSQGSTLLDPIFNDIGNSNTKNDFIYDVKIPDGKDLMGLTIDEVEDLKNVYDVVWASNLKFKEVSSLANKLTPPFRAKGF